MRKFNILVENQRAPSMGDLERNVEYQLMPSYGVDILFLDERRLRKGLLAKPSAQRLMFRFTGFQQFFLLPCTLFYFFCLRCIYIVFLLDLVAFLSDVVILLDFDWKKILYIYISYVSLSLSLQSLFAV